MSMIVPRTLDPFAPAQTVEMPAHSAALEAHASRQRRVVLWVAAAVLVGLIVRAPGVLWGSNFPLGWYGHHVDEYTHLVNAELLINPTLPPRWPPNPYPKATAAHAAAPLLLAEASRGRLFDGLPSPQTIMTTGRVVAVLYGTATILLVALIARQLFTDPRVAIVAAWMMALGGLHVTQSHFFLADVPVLFWHLLGSYFVLKYLTHRDRDDARLLAAAAFCFGAAFAVKLMVAGAVSLLAAVWLTRPRMTRLALAASFALSGFVVASGASYTAFDVLRSFVRGTTDPYEFSRLFSLLVYTIQLPSLVSLPVLALAAVGSWVFGGRFLSMQQGPKKTAILVAVLVPQAILLVLVLSTMDNFLRHLVPFIPWIALLAAAMLVSAADSLRARGVPAALIVAPVFAYLALFVVDGERGFIREPRNLAANWLLAHAPQGTTLWWQGHGWLTRWPHVVFPREGRPEFLVVEMHRANEYLSGMGWKNSMPRQKRFVFGGRSQQDVQELQSLFEGGSEYREAARFGEGYVMPEYRLVNRLLGNRSRNYLAEIVIFRKQADRPPRAAEARFGL